MIAKIKKLFNIIISLIMGRRARGAVLAKGDVLDIPLDIAKRLCGHLKNHRHTRVEQVVEAVTMHRFALLLRRKLSSMKRTTDVPMFNAMYHDAVMFAAGIADNKVIDTVPRNLAKSLFEELVSLADANIFADTIAVYEVVFGGKGKTYCYKGNTNAFGTGRYVCVPVGEEGEIRIVRIVNVLSIDNYKGDYPIDKMKPILSNAFLSGVVAAAIDKNKC